MNKKKLWHGTHGFPVRSSHNFPRPLSDKRFRDECTHRRRMRVALFTLSTLLAFFHITTTHLKSFYLVTCYNSIGFDILLVLWVFNKALWTAFLFCMFFVVVGEPPLVVWPDASCTK
jgi:hypothetical protein